MRVKQIKDRLTLYDQKGLALISGSLAFCVCAVVAIALSPKSVYKTSSVQQMDSTHRSYFAVAKRPLTIIMPGREKQVLAGDIGISTDVPATMEQLSLQQNWLRRIHQSTPLRLHLDHRTWRKFMNDINAQLPERMKQPSIVFNAETEQFQLQEGKSGTVVDEADFISQVVRAVERNFHTVKVPLLTQEPSIAVPTAETAMKRANEFIQNEFRVVGSYQTYQPAKSEKAQWVVIAEDVSSQKYEVKADTQATMQYVLQKGHAEAPGGQAKRVLIQDKLIQEGYPSMQVANVEKISKQAAHDFAHLKPVQIRFTLSEQPPQAVEMTTMPQWIEINLTNQTLAAYEKERKVFGPVYITSGMGGHETVTGLFHVWLKNYVQTMKGGSKANGTDYDIPNVQWVSYFHEEYAIHGAWWRDYFGTPGSHGCVNMTNADAQWIYEWNDIGTPVLVHY